jgi:chloramphenicol-sensitive protein RarD
MNPGILHAALAYVCWGLFPLYFMHLAAVPALQVVAHRVIWSLLFVLGLLAARGQWAWLRPALRDRRLLGISAVSALLLSANWLLYIWAVNHHHVLDASLGYFINPLVNVLLGTWVLKERLRRGQWAAVALAGVGVLWLTVQGGALPWVALLLAATFGLYGLMRKQAPLGALDGLTLETLMLAPAALALLAGVLAGVLAPAAVEAPSMAIRATNALLAVGAPSAVAHNASDAAATALPWLWLIGVGPVTAVPLLLFASGARRIPLSTLGLLQYIAPTLQFMCGLWVFHEPLSAARLAGYAVIWLALLIYALEGWQHSLRSTG